MGAQDRLHLESGDQLARSRVLVIDDDAQVRGLILLLLSAMGQDAEEAGDLATGLALAQAKAYDLVLLDVRLPDGNGIEALPRFRSSKGAPDIIIITGLGDPNGAELAIRNGAWDYIEKPCSAQDMRLPIVRVLQHRQVKQMVSSRSTLKRADIVGSSAAMNACLELVSQAAACTANVLLVGETGTGKELFARAIHDNSERARGSLVTVDCAALPESLVESCLFGYEKGSYTGAEKSQEGLIRLADGGTLFLDEVGELPPSMQKAFLRVLQERRFRPIGSKTELTSDFRLIAATNRDLPEMVRQGTFRNDLLYRLESMTIQVPPLRDRLEDIPELVAHHLPRLTSAHKTELKDFSPAFLEMLTQYEWPGNVRELINALEKALLASGPELALEPQHLPLDIRAQAARSRVRSRPTNGEATAESAAEPGELSLKEYRELAAAEAEKTYLQRVMESTGGDFQAACRRAGLSRTQLYALLRKHNLTRPERVS
jgi:two-component system NtrC family response regulator